MNTILIVTTEPLPLAGWPTTGAGLRAWGLAEGLRSGGFDVRLLMPSDARQNFDGRTGSKLDPETLRENIGTFERSGGIEPKEFDGVDVVVLQHWGVAQYVPEVPVPLAIDLAGPHLLERRLWGSQDPAHDLEAKLAALRRADYLTCSGEDQRKYFLPYLSLAGWDISSAGDPCPVIPYSLKADPTPAPVCSDRFLYGGFFLPWQDPAIMFEVLLDEMDRQERGEIIFVGGEHPHSDVSGGKFDSLLERLKGHPRVKCHAPMAYDNYVDILRQGGIALDLMARNAERELAFTTRTVQYMALGLPVIHDNYSELGRLIHGHDAGWIFDPENREGLRNLFQGLLDGSINPKSQSQAAHSLVHETLDWNKTITPLAQFCGDPQVRSGKAHQIILNDSKDLLLEKAHGDVAKLKAQLSSLRGKRWVRLGLSIFSFRNIVKWPLALLTLLAAPILFLVFWIGDRTKPH